MNELTTNNYLTSATTSSPTTTNIDGWGTYLINGTGFYTIGIDTVVGLNISTDKKGGIHPVLYFKYIKSKFKILERMRLDRRLKYLENAYFRTAEAGQVSLSEKILKILAIETRESMMYAKGIRHFIERDDLVKYKNKIRDGHISDTMMKEFTRVIPKNVLAKKEKVKDVFDDFVIYHYWNEEAEKNREVKQKITPEEKSKLRDPVLFGIIKETDKLYFIADWEDDFCDLSFSEMIDVIGKDDDEFELPAKPDVEKYFTEK